MEYLPAVVDYFSSLTDEECDLIFDAKGVLLLGEYAPTLVVDASTTMQVLREELKPKVDMKKKKRTVKTSRIGSTSVPPLFRRSQ